jgi:hypothetical protein
MALFLVSWFLILVPILGSASGLYPALTYRVQRALLPVFFFFYPCVSVSLRVSEYVSSSHSAL